MVQKQYDRVIGVKKNGASGFTWLPRDSGYLSGLLSFGKRIESQLNQTNYNNCDDSTAAHELIRVQYSHNDTFPFLEGMGRS